MERSRSIESKKIVKKVGDQKNKFNKIKHFFLISEIIKLADFLRTGIVLPLIYTF